MDGVYDATVRIALTVEDHEERLAANESETENAVRDLIQLRERVMVWTGIAAAVGSICGGVVMSLIIRALGGQ